MFIQKIPERYAIEYGKVIYMKPRYRITTREGRKQHPRMTDDFLTEGESERKTRLE